MELALIILFIVVGLIFLLVEILVTPGIVLGVVGIAFMSFGIWKTYGAYGSNTGNIVLVSTFVLTIVIVVLALKGGVWKRMASKDTIGSRALRNLEELVKVGDKGKTLSALRPSGNAMFGTNRLEVSTQGEPIEAGSEIEVIRLSRSKVIVKRVES